VKWLRKILPQYTVKHNFIYAQVNSKTDHTPLLFPWDTAWHLIFLIEIVQIPGYSWEKCEWKMTNTGEKLNLKYRNDTFIPSSHTDIYMF
jgi:hypothetical protein